jgi:GT2 family glycosyltransferase
LYGKDFAKIQHAGVQLLRDRRCTHRLLHAPYNVISSNIKKICQAVTFAVVGISVECYNEIKLDEDMPNDWNDIDFCIRARKGGWKVVYDADALAIHLETATRKEFKETLNSIGKELFIKRHEDLLKKQISYADLRDNECFGY